MQRKELTGIKLLPAFSRMNALRKVNHDAFVAVADGIVNRTELHPLVSGKSRFFFELPACGFKRILTLVDLSGRNFPKRPIQRAAPLPFKYGAILVIEYHHGCRPGMRNHFSCGNTAVRQFHFTTQDVQKSPRIYLPLGKNRFFETFINRFEFPCHCSTLQSL